MCLWMCEKALVFTRSGTSALANCFAACARFPAAVFVRWLLYRFMCVCVYVPLPSIFFCLTHQTGCLFHGEADRLK